MREALVAALAEVVTVKLGRFVDFTSDQLTRLAVAVDDDVHVSETPEVRERVERIVGAIPARRYAGRC